MFILEEKSQVSNNNYNFCIDRYLALATHAKSVEARDKVVTTHKFIKNSYYFTTHMESKAQGIERWNFITLQKRDLELPIASESAE